MNGRMWAIIGAIIAVFVGILVFNGHQKAKTPSASSNAQPTSHITGLGQKNVTLIEYGDYQCPACLQYYPLVKAIEAKYHNDIFLQFRNLPLTQIHPNAFAGARAAEAAGLQNKYWEMHDLLYENQKAWSGTTNPQPFFEIYANQLGLKAAQFKQDFASQKVNDAINADLAEFKKTGQPLSTPHFFLDNTNISPHSVDEFSKLIDAEIAKKNPAKP